MDQKIALITGASSGIGADIALKLAKLGWRTILVARRQDRLNHLAAQIHSAAGSADVFAADLTREDKRIALHQQITDQIGTPDLLINNAGLGWYGYFADMPWEIAREILAVNIDATVHLTRLFIPAMRSRRSGHIINVGSVSGGLPSQGIVMYGASKAFLDAFTEALYREMRGSGVQISVLRLGPVTTEFFELAASRKSGRRIPAESLAIPVERVTKRIVSLIRYPQKVAYVPGGLRIVPLVSLGFGWLIDLLGPLLLRKKPAQS
jgi:uncharacterized protein